MAEFVEVEFAIPIGGTKGDPTRARAGFARIRNRFPHVVNDTSVDYTQPYLSTSGYSWTQNPDPDERVEGEAPQWWLSGLVVYPAVSSKQARKVTEQGLAKESGLCWRREQRTSFEPDTVFDGDH